jgi:uncharacterized cysteine cluster protein YcgN (CxxCxxCC family)
VTQTKLEKKSYLFLQMENSYEYNLVKNFFLDYERFAFKFVTQHCNFLDEQLKVEFNAPLRTILENISFTELHEEGAEFCQKYRQNFRNLEFPCFVGEYDLHLMKELPTDTTPYKKSYIYCEGKERTLYYVHPNGEPQVVQVPNGPVHHLINKYRTDPDYSELMISKSQMRLRARHVWVMFQWNDHTPPGYKEKMFTVRPTEDYQKNPDLYLMEAYRSIDVRKRLQEKNSLGTTDPQYPTKIDDELNVYINYKRDYSVNSNQLQWAKYSKETVDTVSNYFSTHSDQSLETTDLEAYFRMLGDRRLEIAVELSHGDNYEKSYKEVSRSLHYSLPLTHFYGALRGLDGAWDKIGEIIRINPSTKQYTPWLSYEKTLSVLDKFKSRSSLKLGFFKSYSETDNEDFQINVAELTDDLFEIRVEYPNIINSSRARDNIAKIKPYLDAVRNYPEPHTEEETKEFMKCLGRFAYHEFRALRYRLGTSGITEWQFRGLADYKGLILGPVLGNEKELEKKPWRAPLDWEAFTSSEDEFVEIFAEAFQWIKLKNEPSHSKVPS